MASSSEVPEGAPIKPRNDMDAGDFPKSVTLADGTEVPVGLPPGMDPNQANMAIEFMKANPEYAQNTMKQVNQMMKNPTMAQSLLRMQALMASDEYRERMATLREDPDLKPMFEELSTRGPEALDKYWNNMEMMQKISQKMSGLDLAQPPNVKKAPVKVTDLHSAAKVGDVEAIKKFVEDGQDINKQDARGITPLGVAVGFNKVPAVKELIDLGADVTLTDKQGNTVLHYSAGYGRLEAGEMLLKAGADLNAMNKENQTALDVAELNREILMIDFLKKKMPQSEQDKYV